MPNAVCALLSCHGKALNFDEVISSSNMFTLTLIIQLCKTLVVKATYFAIPGVNCSIRFFRQNSELECQMHFLKYFWPETGYN
jgi:hypothetical protein